MVPGRNALIVELDPAVRAIVQDLLVERGYSVHAVASRSEGFDAMEQLAPDLLFLDDPGRERVRRLVRLDAPGSPDVELTDVRPDAVRAWLEQVLA